MGAFDWLRPGRDHQLADDIAARGRVARSRSATRAARAGQDWEDKDRARDRRGDRLTIWSRS
ncbi:hypothetical protein [Streptomyces arenae]|uniref:hypothetical protein n=1 Tax=Streptomyces arenae TaxID=29301 RepID=UPI002658E82B|nr:hypothetical protein [Streptomyces arenae]MCG7203979.1 hypothetical protein [Streptomyces arenae]